jgi:hypothetical protein
LTVDGVTSRATFVAFIEELRADLLASGAAEARAPSSGYGPAVGGWENPTLERFLDALATYATDAGHQIQEPPQWHTFAQLLAAAKIYE